MGRFTFVGIYIFYVHLNFISNDKWEWFNHFIQSCTMDYNVWFPKFIALIRDKITTIYKSRPRQELPHSPVTNQCIVTKKYVYINSWQLYHVKYSCYPMIYYYRIENWEKWKINRRVLEKRQFSVGSSEK